MQEDGKMNKTSPPTSSPEERRLRVLKFKSFDKTTDLRITIMIKELTVLPTK
jgi:hypothetical protein